MVGNSARYRTSVADGGPDPPRPVSLAPEYRRLIARAHGGANCYAPSGGAMFTTLDRDLSPPREHLSSIDTGKLPP